MKTNYGTIFKKIRRSKNISQKFMSDQNISQSEISKFENGYLMLRANEFMQLIGKLNITPNEFIYIMNDYMPNQITKISKQLNYNNYLDNLEQLKKLLFVINEEYKFNSTIALIHIKAIIQAKIKILENKDLKKGYKEARLLLKPVKDYLLKVDTWTLYEITIMMNSLFLFDIDYVKQLSDVLKRSIQNYINYPETNDKMIYLFINLSKYFLDYEKYQDSWDSIEEAYILAKKYNNVFALLICKYIKGLLEILFFNKKIKGDEEIKTTLHIMDLLDIDISNFKQDLNKRKIFISNLK